jgi:bacterioferritin (cytochrome b1)
MNETNQQIVNVAKEAIEKILTLTETTQTPQPETQDITERVVDKSTDKILEDSYQIKQDIVDRVSDTIDTSDISDDVYNRLDIDDIVRGVAERVDDDEIAQKIADTIVEQECVVFYEKLVTALMVKIAEAEEAKKAKATA